MILSYDSVLGVPIVESSGENTSNSKSNRNNMGINLGVTALLLLDVIIILFVTLFST